ncbi:MAG: BlaI/MecI/CopY family transcriptional regulator [Acidobacteria bacterium]|nr:BlaI/MecI/CopY family transcriptional regulator [Acidobacteriota bacterium]
MASKSLPKPTDGELAILRVLWAHGPCTVRQAFEVLNQDRETGYTTVLKMLQIMTEKGLVSREEEGRGHVYEARLGESQAQKHLVTDLLDKAFEGSALRLVMSALQSKKASKAELDAIRKLLDEHGGKS